MVNLNTSLNAQQRGWGPGWPHCQESKMAQAKGGDISVTMHEDICELVGLLLDETLRRGYVMDKGPHDDWGFSCRPITGTTDVPSNHSWGLAIDINASRNPYGSHLVTDMPRWMPDLWNSFGFRWGGDYSGNKDAMHYEFMGTPQEAKAMLDKARKELGGVDEEMAYEDFKTGWKLYNDGKQPGDKASSDVVFGYNAAKAAQEKGGSGPGPTTVPEHKHVPGDEAAPAVAKPHKHVAGGVQH